MRKTYLTFLGLMAAAFSVQAQDPTTNPPTPTYASGVVTSLFSNAYTNKASVNFNESTSRASVSDITVSGNTIKKYTFLANQGYYTSIVFSSGGTLNGTNFQYLHLDIYTTTGSFFNVKLVDFGADNASGGTGSNADMVSDNVTVNLTPNTWNSVDIPISSFKVGANNFTQRANLAKIVIAGNNTSNTTNPVVQFDSFYYLDNIYFNSSSTLPVTLTDFVAKASSNGAVLNWKTASEEKFNGFEVEHRTDNSDFKAIEGVFISGGKNTYSYTHNNPVNGNNYYRLKMVDQDGTFEYSDIEVVQYGLANADVKVQCYPNPVAEQLNIGFNASTVGEAIISLQDLQGRTISKTKVNAASGDNQAVINTSSLNKGVYLVSISLNGKVLGSQKVVK